MLVELDAGTDVPGIFTAKDDKAILATLRVSQPGVTRRRLQPLSACSRGFQGNPARPVACLNRAELCDRPRKGVIGRSCHARHLQASSNACSLPLLGPAAATPPSPPCPAPTRTAPWQAVTRDFEHAHEGTYLGSGYMRRLEDVPG